MTTIDPARNDSSPRASECDLRDIIAVALRRWPSAGVAVAVVRDGLPVRYFCHGVAGVASGRRVSEGTVFRGAVAPHPEQWRTLCGWYAPDAGPVTNLFARVGFGAGVEVAVRHGRLVLASLIPVPGLWDAMVLHPDDPDDPRVYRVELPRYDKTWRSCSQKTRLLDCCSTSCRSRSGPTCGTRAAGAPASRPPASLAP